MEISEDRLYYRSKNV